MLFSPVNAAAFGPVNADFSVTSPKKKTCGFSTLSENFLEKRKMKEHSTSFFMVSLSERPEIDQKEGIPICCDASSY